MLHHLDCKPWRWGCDTFRLLVLAVSFSLGSEELSDLNSSFAAIDKDGDGTISRAEFDAFIKSGGIQDRTEIKDMFDAIDQDKTGIIKYSEFIAAALKEQTCTPHSHVLTLFRVRSLETPTPARTQALIQ